MLKKLRLWLEAREAKQPVGQVAFKGAIDSLQTQINSLRRDLEANKSFSGERLEADVKQMRGQIEQISRRLIGFSKTGIS